MHCASSLHHTEKIEQCPRASGSWDLFARRTKAKTETYSHPVSIYVCNLKRYYCTNGVGRSYARRAEHAPLGCTHGCTPPNSARLLEAHLSRVYLPTPALENPKKGALHTLHLNGAHLRSSWMTIGKQIKTCVHPYTNIHKHT